MIQASGLTKVFGSDARGAAALLERGASRAEVMRETGVTVAVHDVSFQVVRGELFVVMGLSGSGKSTLVRMINRLVEPTAGGLEIDGRDAFAMDAAELRDLRNRRLSMVFQHFALLPHRTVLENAAYGLQIRGEDERTRTERARRALAQVGLEDWSDARPAELSGGMKQRVGLARALATDADVLLMDEPFSALDPLIRRDMQDLLAGLRRELGKTIVFITHDLNEAMRLGDRILILRDGRTVQLGTRSELLSAPADGYVEDFVADVDRSRVLTAADALDPETDAADGRRDGAVSADRPLVDLVPVLAGREEPVAVVGSDGQPLGAVSRRSLLEALAPATRTATHA